MCGKGGNRERRRRRVAKKRKERKTDGRGGMQPLPPPPPPPPPLSPQMPISHAPTHPSTHPIYIRPPCTRRRQHNPKNGGRTREKGGKGMQVCKNGSLACGEKVHLAGSYFFSPMGYCCFSNGLLIRKKAEKTAYASRHMQFFQDYIRMHPVLLSRLLHECHTLALTAPPR